MEFPPRIQFHLRQRRIDNPLSSQCPLQTAIGEYFRKRVDVKVTGERTAIFNYTDRGPGYAVYGGDEEWKTVYDYDQWQEGLGALPKPAFLTMRLLCQTDDLGEMRGNFQGVLHSDITLSNTQHNRRRHAIANIQTR